MPQTLARIAVLPRAIDPVTPVQVLLLLPFHNLFLLVLDLDRVVGRVARIGESRGGDRGREEDEEEDEGDGGDREEEGSGSGALLGFRVRVSVDRHCKLQS